MNEEMKKKLILKLELYDDGTSTTEHDLLGTLAYLQKVANEGGKAVDVISDIICKIGVAVEKKSISANTEVQKLRREARDIADQDAIDKVLAEKQVLQSKLEDIASELYQAQEKIKELESKRSKS